jgi:hypothetical protein
MQNCDGLSCLPDRLAQPADVEVLPELIGEQVRIKLTDDLLSA